MSSSGIEELEPRGAAGSNLDTPPPPPDLPKFSNASLSKLRFLGKVLVPKARKFCFWPPEWVIFFFSLSVYTQNTKIFVENSKMVEKRKKKFDPWPDLRVRPWLMGA